MSSLHKLALLNLGKKNHSKFPLAVVVKVGESWKKLTNKVLRIEEAYLNSTSGGQMTVHEAIARNQRVVIPFPEVDNIPLVGSKRCRDSAVNDFNYPHKTTLPSQAFADEIDNGFVEVMNSYEFEMFVLGETTAIVA